MSTKIKGFTLIELLVVVAIISILAAVGVVVAVTLIVLKQCEQKNHNLIVKQVKLMIAIVIYGSVQMMSDYKVS